MIITKNDVAESINIVNWKRVLWEKYLNVKFDQYGRARLKGCSVVNLNYNDISKYFKGENALIYIRKDFIESFNEYLIKTHTLIGKPVISPLDPVLNLSENIQCLLDENYINTINERLKEIGYFTNKEDQINTLYNFVEQIESGESIPLESFITNKLTVKISGHGWCETKLSKILSKVQNIWLSKNTEYTCLIKKIKNLRNIGINNSNIVELKSLILKKNGYEKNNLYFDYQKIKNSWVGGELYISINPLDMLNLSGKSYKSIEDNNPTSFETCLSNIIEKETDRLKVTRKTVCGNPELQLIIGKILNHGLMFIKNSNVLNVPQSQFNLIGYKARANCWLDEDGLYLNKVYPLESKYKFELNGIKIFRGYEKTFSFQDVELNRKCNELLLPYYRFVYGIDITKDFRLKTLAMC